jgi:hypothetical protein
VPDEFAMVSSWRDDWVAVQVTGVVAAAEVGVIGEALRVAPGRRVQLDLTRAEILAPGFTETVAQWHAAFDRVGRVLAVLSDEPDQHASSTVWAALEAG